jgi:taurine dioxygenase
MDAQLGERITVRRLTGGCGAEILGIDLTRDLADAAIALIRDTMHETGVVFFRDQDITPEQHIAFAQRFGPIVINKFFPATGGYPEIAVVHKDVEDVKNIGGEWHTDHSYDTAPAMGSILVAREVPDAGGDTLFANMYAAHDALPDAMKETLSRMRAVHSADQIFGPDGRATRTAASQSYSFHSAELAAGEVSHPVIIRHPDSGRPALYVNPTFTVRFDGWTQEQSLPLLEELYAHATRPEWTCRFRWAPGSIAFWDNRATMHYAVNDYHGEVRTLHRITIDGTELE